MPSSTSTSGHDLGHVEPFRADHRVRVERGAEHGLDQGTQLTTIDQEQPSLPSRGRVLLGELLWLVPTTTVTAFVVVLVIVMTSRDAGTLAGGHRHRARRARDRDLLCPLPRPVIRAEPGCPVGAGPVFNGMSFPTRSQQHCWR